jgi:very-short-patch-repair endonuclease
MLQAYLAYAESGGANLGNVAKDKPELNPFEQDVEARLRAVGIPLIPQYGCSGYWIDFAAQHPTRPGQMVLAIECDGATYHSSATARDRDRLRQEHLERLGWTFHRIWSQDWFYHHEKEISRALAAYQKAVGAADNGDHQPPPAAHAMEQSTPTVVSDGGPAHRPGPCPIWIHRGSIGEYSMSELATLARWIESDTLLRTEDQLLAEMMRVLGFMRRGSKITAALTNAIAWSRRTG